LNKQQNDLKIYIEEIYPSHFYTKTTLLDPRFKKAAFTLNDNANDAEQEVQKEIAFKLFFIIDYYIHCYPKVKTISYR